MRKSFQFKVAGIEQTGVIYVTRSFADGEEAQAIEDATKIAARRSGDPDPVFVCAVAPVR